MSTVTMTNKSPAYSFPQATTCQICGCDINPSDLIAGIDPDYPVCRAFDCQKTLSQKSSMSPVLFKAHVAFQRKLMAERMAREAAQKKLIEAVTKKQSREHKLILQSILSEHPQLHKDDTYFLVIPSGMSKLIPPTAERIADFTEHLQQIISQAAEYSDASEVVQDQHYVAHEKLAQLEHKFADNPPLQAVSNHLCGMCQGGCCASGKDHAYLSVITIRRYMDKHPDASQQAIKEMYLSHIASETLADACINQTTRGCALPRELRSDICNEYYCDGIKRLHKQRANTIANTTVLAIQRSANHWNQFNLGVCNDIRRVALVDKDKIQMMAIPANVDNKNKRARHE